MTEKEVKEFRALADAATEGEWSVFDLDPEIPEIEHPGIEANGLFVVILGHQRGGGDGGVRGRTPEEARANAAFIAAARNNAVALCEMALYAMELEGYVHDFSKDEVPAALLAEARRLGREEMLDVVCRMTHHVRCHDEKMALLAERTLPPLPAEPETNRELRAELERLARENEKLRWTLARAVDDNEAAFADPHNCATAWFLSARALLGDAK